MRGKSGFHPKCPRCVRRLQPPACALPRRGAACHVKGRNTRWSWILRSLHIPGPLTDSAVYKYVFIYFFRQTEGLRWWVSITEARGAQPRFFTSTFPIAFLWFLPCCFGKRKYLLLKQKRGGSLTSSCCIFPSLAARVSQIPAPLPCQQCGVPPAFPRAALCWGCQGGGGALRPKKKGKKWLRSVDLHQLHVSCRRCCLFVSGFIQKAAFCPSLCAYLG